jgi:hypothetical protein
MLEFVLCLFILLAVMFLMIYFGNAAAWKVRGLVMARNSAWTPRRADWDEPAAGFPRPWYWSAPANSGSRNLAPTDVPEFASLDVPGLQPADHVVRGPMPVPVNENLLDPSQTVRQGDSNRQLAFPLVRGMNQINVRSRHALLEGRWLWQEMTWPQVPWPWDWTPYAHLEANIDRRVSVLYLLPTVQDTGLRLAYIKAVIAVYYASFLPDLYALDHNTEFIRYSRTFGWRIWDYEAPDYHPIPGGFCTTDSTVARQRVDQLIADIKNVPKRMTDDLISQTMVRDANNPLGPQHPRGLYPWVIWELQNRINAQPPPPQNQIAAMQAEINQLQQKIDILQQFFNTLP